ncbi:unnamed protein product [Rotaria sordida]|uniref:Uncharacterized protein n=1 Tax=Rotaria sordida TaxID=392033 RepID=A0A818ZFH2_9BILA|nr:unnamed protein product [Rotaria sordida]
MLNYGTETNSYENDNNFHQNYRRRNSQLYTKRQWQSAFCPPADIDFQQTMISLAQQHLFEQCQLLDGTQQSQYYPEQTILSLPQNVDMSMIQTPYTQLPILLHEQHDISNAYASVNQQCHSHSSTVPLTISNLQEDQTLKETVEVDSLSSSTNTNLNEKSISNKTQVTVNESISVTDNPEIKTTTSFIYDLKKYKYDYFLSKLSCSSNHDYGKFGLPTGICTLPDDRLLVANFDHDSLLLIDINGIVHQIYKDLPTPKDVRYYSSNPLQAIVATKKEVIILDLEKSQIVVKSKLKGFYPWNIQYIQEQNTISACDPSGERIVFFNKDLACIGEWLFNNANQQALCHLQSQPYNKVYPYAAYLLPDNTSFILKCCDDKFQIEKLNPIGQTSEIISNIPPTLKSYSIYVDSTRQCLIPDKVNHSLVSIDKDSIVEQYKFTSIQEPYSMTFLSTGTLCITDHNKSCGTNGGISVISEINLKSNQ